MPDDLDYGRCIKEAFEELSDFVWDNNKFVIKFLE
jgi:hypothetical protein